MLNATISKMILNVLTKGQSAAEAIASTAYLALLTEMPDSDGTGAEEVDKDDMKGYSRLRLGSLGVPATSLDGNSFFPETGAQWSEDDNAYKIENTANMQMSAIEEGVTAEAEIFGFAICKSSNTPVSATEMLAWGTLIDAETGEPTTVTLSGGSVPIFYYDSTNEKGDFTLLLGAADAAEE